MNIKTQQNPSSVAADTALLKTQGSEKTRKGQETKGEGIENAPLAGKSYNVSLSSESKNLQEAQQKAHDIAMNTSPVREDRVKALKEKIKNGTYEVDSGKIADGMLKEAIKDKLAMSE